MTFINRKQAKYKEVFNGSMGEFVLASIFDFAGFYKQSFVANDPHTTSFNEGKRAVALHILQLLALKEEDIRELVRSYRSEMFSAQTEQEKI